MDFTKNINFNVNNLIKDQSFKLTYNGPLAQNSTDVFIHFGFDSSWQNIGHMKMEKIENGFSIDIVPQNFSSFNFCFVDSNNNWDNNNGLNYSAEIHAEDEYIKTAYADTIENTCDDVISSMFSNDLQKTINQLKSIVSYKKLGFVRYFYNTGVQSTSENTESTISQDSTSDLRTISNYKKIEAKRYIYNQSKQTVDSQNVKEDSSFESESIEISPLEDYTSYVKVNDSILKTNFRKYDFTKSFEKYKIKNAKNNLAINFKHNFNLSDSKKLCILGYSSFDNYTCEKSVSQSFVAHFAESKNVAEEQISIDQPVSVLYTIKGFSTLPGLYYTGATVFNNVLEIGTELSKEFDNYYENNYSSAETVETDSVANEIMDSIVEVSDDSSYIEQEDALDSKYTVDYNTFAELLDEIIEDEESASSILESLVFDPTTALEFIAEENATENDSPYMENINKILEESVTENPKEDVFDAFSNLDIENSSQTDTTFENIKTSEDTPDHVSHHSLGERAKKERITENMDSILDYLDSEIESYQSIQETQEDLSTKKDSSISPAILDVLTNISTEGFEFDSSFVKAEQTDIDMKEYSSISQEFKDDLYTIQELEVEQEKLEMAFESQESDIREILKEETSLTVQSDSSLSNVGFFSKFNVLKRKVKLCLYKVFNVLPKMLKEKLFGYDD